MADSVDPSLIHRLKLRKAAAWAEAYDSQARDVFTFIAHLMRVDRPAAEEIHQETWLAALAGIDGFDAGRGEFRAWIFAIARRQVALHLRRRLQNRCESAGSNGRGAFEGPAILPLDVLSLVERGDAVRAALAELGAESRDVLLGKYVEGHSVNELAGRLGRTPKAIESLLSRSRERMRSLLAWYFENENSAKDLQR